MPISRDAVMWAFRLVLGREPESEQVVLNHMRLPGEEALLEALLRSNEFRIGGRLASTVSIQPTRAQRSPVTGLRLQQRSRLRTVVFGNCQAAPVARLIEAMTGCPPVEAHEVSPGFIGRLASGEWSLEPVLRGADRIILQSAVQVDEAIRTRFAEHLPKVRRLPNLTYAGFHPDVVYIESAGGERLRGGPMGEQHSSLALWAWRHGLDVARTVALFNPDVFHTIGFHDHHGGALRQLLAWGVEANLPLGQMVDGWRSRGSFMLTVNHPRQFALADLVAAMLRRDGVEPILVGVDAVDDTMARWPVWPVYPPLAEAAGFEGGYDFKIDVSLCPPGQPVQTLALDEFVARSQACFKAADGALRCARVDSPAYGLLARHVEARPSLLGRVAGALRGGLIGRTTPPVQGIPQRPPSQPYADLPDERWWRSAVAEVPPAAIDPIGRAGFRIDPGTRVATAGSCFAQNIARHLQRAGFNYLVADADPTLDADTALQRQFGVFSARYGNIYTARQLVQLFDRAHGGLLADDLAWQRPDGRWVDPLRPRIEPAGFKNPIEVRKTRRRHLDQVRTLFAELDVFVFTLGLTEAWRQRADGIVLPVPPGVVGGTYDPSTVEFVNFDVESVLDDLHGFARRLRGVNPGSRIILTVSPVPLIATFEDRHVLVSTAESKAILRAAAGRFAAATPRVDYFPSYEIICGTPSRGAYFENDLRAVTEAGVDHVMRLFFQHYAGAAAPAEAHSGAPAPALAAMAAEHAALGGLVCDEETLEARRQGR